MTSQKHFLNVSPQQREAIKKDIMEVIAAVSERIHYAESRRTNFSVIAGVLVAGGVALITFALGNIDSMLVKYIVAGSATALILFGTILFLVYARQTNRYPWTSATNTWKWFYRDALPKSSAFDLSWHSYFRFGKEGDKAKAAYGAQLGPFKDHLTRLADDVESLNQDAEQLYVLHVNEKYKNMHLTDLRRVTTFGLFIVLPTFAILGGTYGFYLDRQHERPKQIHYARSGVSIDASWHPLSSIPDSRFGELLLQIHITNTSTLPYALPRWNAEDADGNSIPTELLVSTSTAQPVAPKSSVRYSVLLRSGASAIKAVSRIQADAY
jgi:hypothetical protein